MLRGDGFQKQEINQGIGQHGDSKVLAESTIAPAADPKDHAWSHMAGWYGAKGCDEFYQALWNDEAVSAQLEKRLVANGSWRAIETIAR